MSETPSHNPAEEEHQEAESPIIQANRERIKAIHAKLSPEQLIFADQLIAIGAVTGAEENVFEFVSGISPEQCVSFLKFTEGKNKVWSENTLKEKMEFFQQNYAFPLNDKEATAILESQPESINYAEAKKLGLEANILRGSEAARKLLQAIANPEVAKRTIDITTPAGQKAFVKQWKENCPNLPMPCVPPKDFWYLTRLSQNRIISNLEGDNQPEPPRFEDNEILFVDNWQEQDYDSTEAASSHHSKLLQVLLGNDSTVNISREAIDQALWKGDPALRQPTTIHLEVLKKFGCDPAKFELRLIRQDEYARLASAKGLGQKNLWTNFDDYFLGDDGARNGLVGGYRAVGGPSDVGSDWRGDAGSRLAVRLVLSRKR